MKEIKEYMMKTSPRVEFLPMALYHASPKENYNSIVQNGIKANELFGQTYFCNTKKQCILFTGKNVDIYEVDTKELSEEQFRISLDHSKEHYPFDCYAYYEDIPVSKIKKVHRM